MVCPFDHGGYFSGHRDIHVTGAYGNISIPGGRFCPYFFLSGVSDVYFSFKNRELFKGWIWKMVLGLLNAGIGIFLVVHQEISAALLPYVVGFAIALHSLFGLMVSFEMKDVSLQGWGDTAIFSVLGMVLAIAIILNPLFGGLWLVLSTSFAFLTVGSWNLAFALKLRKLNNELFDH